MDEPANQLDRPGDPDAPDRFVRDIAEFIDARGLLERGQAVLVAVSGGCDSVAMLEVLCRLAAEPGRQWDLSVAHLNHRLRPDADADADFVRELARRRNLPCVVEAEDVAASAAERSVSIETAARDLRYAFLAKTAVRLGATVVAVGHHADDQVETVLLRIARGTHLQGLRGIPARRDLAEAAGVSLVRPLLGMRRERIEQFCLRVGLDWRTDQTNADTTYRRNFIRHELLPMLRDRINPKVDDALLRLADAADETEDHLAEVGRDLLDRARRVGPGRAGAGDQSRLTLDAETLADAPAIHRCYALRAALEYLAAPMGDVTAGHLADLAALPAQSPPAAVTLPGNILARREADELLLEVEPGPVEMPSWHIPLPRSGETHLPDGRTVRCEEFAFDQAAFDAHRADPQPGTEWLDADYVHGPLTIRPRRPGDVFVPLGAPGRQTVSDFLTNSKLPRARRDVVFVIADGQGVIYVAPLRIADHTRVRPTTERVLKITVQPSQRLYVSPFRA